MVKRKKVGFLFSYDENWIAGSYYILNIIHALNILEDKKKPTVIILSKKKEDYDIVKKETDYSYLEFKEFPHQLNLVKRIINKLSRIINKKNVFHQLYEIDFLYPNYTNDVTNPSIKKNYWIPDFQEAFLPELFSDTEIKNRKNHQMYISENADSVVFSSYDAQHHYNKMYPNSKPKEYVLQFAVTHPSLLELNPKEILKKHKLPAKYFFAPNQFWIHKNHIVILKAIKLLKEQAEGADIFLAFSGKDYDHRNKDYVASLKNYIQENNLDQNIAFLGFLDRKEQLVILQQSLAVVQPSLFEGWSTVVEDAKALNKFIILSDLDVHKEQINNNCAFFERNNEKELALLLKKYIEENPQHDNSTTYKDNIRKFGEDFMTMVEQNSI